MSGTHRTDAEKNRIVSAVDKAREEGETLPDACEKAGCNAASYRNWKNDGFGSRAVAVMSYDGSTEKKPKRDKKSKAALFIGTPAELAEIARGFYE